MSQMAEIHRPDLEWFRKSKKAHRKHRKCISKTQICFLYLSPTFFTFLYFITLIVLIAPYEFGSVSTEKVNLMTIRTIKDRTVNANY